VQKEKMPKEKAQGANKWQKAQVPTNGKNSGAKWQKAQGPKGQAGQRKQV